MSDRVLTVDADGHVLEPRNTWVEYLEPEFRDRAIRMVDDDNGDEVLLIDGKPLESMRNRLASLGGIELDPDEVARERWPAALRGRLPAGRLRPGGAPAGHGRRGHRHRAPLPDVGICWEGSVTDPALATAYTRAYNRYIVDFCSHDPVRLVPVAHLSLHRRGRRGRGERAAPARPGCRAVYLSPDLPARAGRALDDPAFDRFWSTLEDLDMPVGFHVVVRDPRSSSLVDRRSGARAASCSASRSSPST